MSLTFLFVCLLAESLAGQDLISLSLEELYERFGSTKGKDVPRVDLLNELAYRLRNHNPDSGLVYAREAREIAETLRYKRGLADSFVRLGLLAYKKGRVEEAESYYLQALPIRNSSGDRRGVAAIYNNLGNLFKSQTGQVEKAVDYFKKGIDMLSAESLNTEESKTKARLHNNLGGLLTNMGAYKKAAQQFEASITVREVIGDEAGKANSLLNLGFLFQKLENYQLAENHFRRSLEIFHKLDNKTGQGKCHNFLGNNYFFQKDYSQALYYYDQALAMKEYLPPHDLMVVIRNKGSAFLELKQKDKALQDFIEGLKFFKEHREDRELASLQFEIGNVYFERSEYPSAIGHYEQSLELLDSLQLPELESKVLYQLSTAHTHLDDFERALRYKDRYVQLRDTLAGNIQDALNYQYNLETSEKENALLNLELERKQKRTMRTYGLIGFGVLWLLLGIAVMGVYLHRSKRKVAESQLLLAEQNEQLVRREIDQLLQEKELEATYARLEGQDIERKRIAEDLHDRLGSMLSTVKLYFAGLDSKISAYQKENRDNLTRANTLLDEACEEVRRIAHNMQSGILSKFGLKAQLEALAGTIREANQLEVELSVHGFNDRLDSALEINLYRIIQELIANVLKHAKASKLSIQLNRFEDVINIIVEDNGKGFDPEQAGKKNGMGLKNVASRVHDLEGILHIDSGKGQGTTTMIDIPCLERV
jgi:two-component system NarL family sensor kinase